MATCIDKLQQNSKTFSCLCYFNTSFFFSIFTLGHHAMQCIHIQQVDIITHTTSCHRQPNCSRGKLRMKHIVVLLPRFYIETMMSFPPNELEIFSFTLSLACRRSAISACLPVSSQRVRRNMERQFESFTYNQSLWW